MNLQHRQLLNENNQMTHCSYLNFEDLMYVQHLISTGTNLTINQYLNTPVLYAFMIPINNIIITVILKLTQTLF